MLFCCLGRDWTEHKTKRKLGWGGAVLAHPLGKKPGACRMKLPADRPRPWTIHHELIRLIWSRKRSSSGFWTDLSRCSAALIWNSSIKETLTGMISPNPPPHLLRSLSFGSAATVILDLQSRLERRRYTTQNHPHSVKFLQTFVAGIQVFITYKNCVSVIIILATC